MKEQQDVWVQELNMINAQLLAIQQDRIAQKEEIERDRIMQESVAKIARGVSIMNFRRA
mgnify:CR=1 FL=1